MGRFTDWMMKDMNDDEFDVEGNSNHSNNYDRQFSPPNNNRMDNERTERRPLDYERMQDKSSYREERREPKRGIFSSKTLPLVNEVKSGQNSNLNVVVYSPHTYEDVQTLIDYLKRHEPVVVNLSGIPEESAQRILDFMSGAIYGLSGSIHRISGNIFLLTPSGVSIMVPAEIKNSLQGQ